MKNAILLLAVTTLLAACATPARADSGPLTKPAFPPGWLPVNRLDDQTPWEDVRKIEDKVHLYLPRGDKPVRGVYLSVVFHSGDPREMARLWDFALVTMPWQMLWDVGLPDKRSPRTKVTGLPMGDMGVLLRYLEAAAVETKHPELAVAPLVGWMMQGGNHHAADLMKRCPDRVIAWADAFSNQLSKVPDVYTKVPYVLAWEFDAKKGKVRADERAAKLPALQGKPTPAPDLRCEANTYGFPHGVYSKWNFFQGYLDRCIRARLPDETPAPGQPTKLKPVGVDTGWCADFNDVSGFVPIAPAKDAQGMVAPQWLPDAYAAWTYRSYHSVDPDIRLTAPIISYKRGGGKSSGLGYGNPAKAGEPQTLTAETTGDYARVDFHDGDKVVGTATAAPWKVEGVKLDRGLHALFPVGVKADGTSTAGRPAYLVVE